MRDARKLGAGIFAGLWLALGAGAAPAAAGGLIIDVNTPLDLPDADLGDGAADADLAVEGLQTTLRAAVQHANATPGADTITLPAGFYALTIEGSLEDFAATGDLDVTDDVTINGAGTIESIIDGEQAEDRLFEVDGDVNLTITNLTMGRGRTGEAEPDDGGGIRAVNGATLTLDDVVITKCEAHGDGGAISLFEANATITDTWIFKNKTGDDGGGIDMDPEGPGTTLVLDRVTFSKNKAVDKGGGLVNSDADVTITNCTFNKNKAAEGGAISCEGGTTTLLSCTLSRNKAKVGSGIADDPDDADVITVSHTIVANKKTTNFSAGNDPLISNGHNIDNGTTCGFNDPTDQEDTNPKLKKLADNGGATPTQALKPDSPALDAGDDLIAPEFDQRGLPRVDLAGLGTDGVLADIGAFELQEL